MDTNFKKFNKSINFFYFTTIFPVLAVLHSLTKNIPMTPHGSKTTGMECQIITMPNIARMAPMTKKAMIGNRIIFKRHPRPFPKPSKRNSIIAPIPSGRQSTYTGPTLKQKALRGRESLSALFTKIYGIIYGHSC